MEQEMSLMEQHLIELMQEENVIDSQTEIL